MCISFRCKSSRANKRFRHYPVLSQTVPRFTVICFDISISCRGSELANVETSNKISGPIYHHISHRKHNRMAICPLLYDDVIKWKHFPIYWPFVRGIRRSPVNSPHKDQWCGALMFSLICALNKRLSKQSWGWWFETPLRSLWRHYNEPIGPWEMWL